MHAASQNGHRPSEPNQGDVTGLLNQLNAGNRDAMSELVPLVYAELRRLAGGYMRRERSNGTIQATALVHEAYLRLVDQREVRWQNRAHFLAIAAQAMRRILVSRARASHASKRGSGVDDLPIDEVVLASPEPAIDLLALDTALERMSVLDAVQSQIVELRFFGGLTVEETAEVLHTSESTIKREWRIARAWLRRELGESAAIHR